MGWMWKLRERRKSEGKILVTLGNVEEWWYHLSGEILGEEHRSGGRRRRILLQIHGGIPGGRWPYCGVHVRALVRGRGVSLAESHRTR